MTEKLEEIVDKILDRSVIFFILLGAIFLILGASGGFEFSNFNIHFTELYVRIVLSLLGIGLISFGIFTSERETNKAKTIRDKEAEKVVEESIFTKWDVEKFKKGLAKADQELCFVAVSNNMLFSNISEELKAFVARGGRIRCVLVRPDSPAMKMVSFRGFDQEKDLSYLKEQYTLSVKSIKNILAAFPENKKEYVKLRASSYLPGLVLTILDPEKPEGIAFITINGFGKHFTVRPSLIIKREKEPEWFKFFYESFEHFWDAEQYEEIPL